MWSNSSALLIVYKLTLFTSYSNEAYEVTVYDSDLMFLLCVWFFRMWVVQWLQEHARQRLGRVRAADSGGYFLTRTTSSPMTTRPSRSRLHARSLLLASCRYLFRPQADLTCLWVQHMHCVMFSFLCVMEMSLCCIVGPELFMLLVMRWHAYELFMLLPM